MSPTMAVGLGAIVLVTIVRRDARLVSRLGGMGPGQERWRTLRRVGHVAQALPAGSSPHPADADDPMLDHEVRVGAYVVGLVAVVVVSPVAGVMAGLASAGLRWWQVRRHRARWTAAVADAVPDMAELLSLAVSSGSTTHQALRSVIVAANGPIVVGFARAMDDVDGGARLADALERLPPVLGPAVGPLIDALVVADRYGDPVAPALAIVADQGRVQRSLRKGEQARRLPVKLLGPLVACVLPAFVLLTVVPVLAGTLDAVRP